MSKLLTRDEFRNAVFARDSSKCVICGEKAVDAHHILERRLFPDGGYYLNNGASLCERHHLEAESTELSASKIRELCGIKDIILPPHLYSDQFYDKWGNPIIQEYPEKRIPGELFNDESVQKVIAPVLHLFSKYIKYPRTYHLPWSPGVGKDDRVLDDISVFDGKNVVVTVKMDGENTTLYNDYMHARSIDYNSHASRDRIKAFWSTFKHDIPDGWRICGENLFAKHSIHYDNLSHFFMIFSIWNDKNQCLSWEDTKEYAKLLNLEIVPILYEGIWDKDRITKLYQPYFDNNECEGYVVRLSEQFEYKAFRKSVAKYVRENHVQTHAHWMNNTVVQNKFVC